MFKKLSLILLLAFVSWAGMANAQGNRALPSEGNWTSQTISSDQTITLTGDVYIKGKITVNKGAVLTINYDGDSPVNIYRMFNGGNTFQVSNGAKLVIHGNENAKIVIDAICNGTLYKSNTFFNLSKGELDLDYVKIQNLYPDGYVQHGLIAWTEGGNSARNTIVMTHTVWFNCGDGIPANGGVKGNTQNLIRTGECLTTIRMEYDSIINCRSTFDYGGLICNGGPDSSCQMLMDNCYCEGNYSTGWGGVILWSAGDQNPSHGDFLSSAHINNCTFKNNHAQFLGGAISAEGTVYLKDNLFIGNHAASGGALDALPFTLSTGAHEVCGLKLLGGNQFIGNYSDNQNESFTTPFNSRIYPVGGGAIYCILNMGNSELTLNVKNETFYDNYTQDAGKGGAIFVVNTVPNNTSAKAYLNVGGENESGELVGPVIHGCYANKGGAIALQDADLAFAKGEVYENGYYVEEDVEIQKTELGGGVYVQGAAKFTGGTIRNNKASKSGGGFYVTGGKGTLELSNMTISNNEALTEDGGGMYVSEGNVSLFSGLIENNTCYRDGGAMYIYVNTKASEVKVGKDDHIGAGPVFRSNVAGRDGGAMAIVKTGSKDVTYDFYGGTVEQNIANADELEHGGGGFYIKGAKKLTIHGGEINHNISKACGGAFCITGGGELLIKTGNVCYNKCGWDASTLSANDIGCGGAFYINGCSVTMNGGKIDYNRSEPAKIEGDEGNDKWDAGCAGGFYVLNGNLTLSGTEETPISICNNYANDEGGAFEVWAYDEHGKDFNINLYKAKIENNTANSHGGAGCIYGDWGRNSKMVVSFDGADINNNTSLNGSGGALYLAMFADFTLKSGNLINNASKIHGGAIFMADNFPQISLSQDYEVGRISFNMIGGIISGNVAQEGMGGGAYILSISTAEENLMNVKNVDVKTNTAKLDGGGIFINGTMNKVIFESGDFIQNVTHMGNGGAISMNGGTMQITGGNVIENYSSIGNGGGIYMSNGANFTMEGGNIENNNAQRAGGGVYADGIKREYLTDEIIGAGGSMTFRKGKIHHNFSYNGGGVYATRGVSINIFGEGNVIYNTAYCASEPTILNTAYHDNEGNNQGIGGGLYIGNGINVNGTEYKTQLNFSTAKESKAPGVFGNMAYFGADDIYVSGYLTKAILPNIDGIEFNGFDGRATGWFEDYVYCDSRYEEDEVNVNKDYDSDEEPKRYRSSKLIGTDVFKVCPETLIGYTWPMDFDNKYLCLTIGYVMETWVTVVDRKPTPEEDHFKIDDNNTCHIYSPEGLAWYISYATGYNFQKNEPVAKAVLENDLDMSAHIWVPIGNYGQTIDGEGTPYDTRTFKGEFDGQGHTITGLRNTNLIPNNIDRVNSVGNAGMFGHIEGGTVKNVFVTGSDFIGVLPGYYGIVADTVSGGGKVMNCEGAGFLMSTLPSGPTSEPTFGCVVGLADNANVHSCIGTGKLQGYMLGGLVGKVGANSKLENSFSNVLYMHYGETGVYHAGGLADENCGTIENCYVRFERVNNLGTMPLSLFANDNTNGIISACYLPEDMAGETLIKTGNAPESYASYSPVNTPYLYSVTDYNTVTLPSGISISGLDTKSLLNTLNNWVDEQHSDYAQWQRTTAGGYTAKGGEINDDLPVHKFADFTSVGSNGGIEGGIVLTYGNLHTELSRKNEVEDGGTVMLYANDEETSLSNDDDVILYIGENVSLIHDANTLKAYTCQTMTMGSETWHTISSSLKRSPIGIKYGIKSQVGWVDDVQGVNNPCDASIMSDDELSLFPSDAQISNIDLYSFYEPEYHWLNLKRNKDSHWHMDDHTQQIVYPNSGYNYDDNLMADGASYLIPGRGYLAAIGKEVLLQNHGELNSGLVEIMVTNEAPEGIDRKGLNLLGNPYQSYLDFEVFADEAYNPTLFSGEPSYLVFDASKNAYCQYKSGSSRGTEAASRYLNMHQGFFIHYTGGSPVKAKFTNDMRVKDAEGISFRDWTPEYALVNLTVRNEQEQGDIAVVELGRPVTEGAVKMKDISSGDAKISFRHDDEDYAVLFLSEETNEVPVRFECDGGTYTLTWSTANADFGYLHLIDNMTGMDIDMLASDGYTFTGNANDYKSRFKMVFAYTGIGENEDADTDAEHAEAFAFFSNGDLIVSGKGNLQVIDMTGHVLYSTRLYDAQSRVSVPQVAAGIYLIRLNEKIQKIVIK